MARKTRNKNPLGGKRNPLPPSPLTPLQAPESQPFRPIIHPLRFFTAHAGLSLLLLWVAFALVQFTFPNFSWQAPWLAAKIPFQQSYGVLAVLFAGLVAVFRSVPTEGSVEDLGPWAARFWLLAALAVAAYLGLYEASRPDGHFWEDFAEVGFARRVADLGDYREAFIFGGLEEPPYVYFQVLLFHLLPGAGFILVQKLAGTLMVMLGVWSFYLLGKEVGGRRTGVFAAGLASVSKAILIKVFFGLRFICLPWAVAFALLFLLRLFKAPTFSRFLHWAFFLALGAYTYSTFRPMVPFFIFLVLGWSLWKGSFLRPGALTRDERWFLATNAIILFLFYGETNAIFAPANPLARVLDVSGPWLPCMVLAPLIFWALRVVPPMIVDRERSLLVGWLAGAWATTLFCFPVMGNHLIYDRMREMEHITGVSTLFSRTFGNFLNSWKTLFWGGWDRADMSIPNDSFFGYSETVVIALGLAFILARLDWIKMVLLATILIGLAPHFLSAGTHSGRALTSVAPFFLIGALGLEATHGAVRRLAWGGLWSKLLMCALLFLWYWTAQGTFSRIYPQFHDAFRNTNTETRRKVLEDAAKGYLPYIGDGLNGVAPFLYEGTPVRYFWPNGNILCLDPKDHPVGIALFIKPDDKVLRERLTKAYPKGTWNPMRMPGFQKPTDDPTILEFLIPFGSIAPYKPPRPGAPVAAVPFFRVQRVTAPYWERIFSPTQMGWSFGYELLEDKTALPAEKPRPDLNLDKVGVLYRGTIHVRDGGDYDLLWKLDGRTILKVDGRTVLDETFWQTPTLSDQPRSGDRLLHLGPGDHQVLVQTWFQNTLAAPDIALKRSGTAGEGRSLWKGFEF